jgi:hypothetical protein
MKPRQWPDVVQRAIAYAPGLVAYVVCALFAGESSFTSWWFFVGVGIYVAAVFVEHHFTSPQDAIVNAAASIGAYLAADRSGADPMWDLYLGMVVVTLVFALIATLPFEGTFKALAFHWATTLGKVRVLGGLALLIEFAHRVQERSEHAIIFGIGAALLLVVVSGRWYTVIGRQRAKGDNTSLADAIGPSQLLLEHVPTSVKRGRVVTIAGAHEVDAVISATLPGRDGVRAVAVLVDGAWQDINSQLDVPITLSDTDTDLPFVGAVGPGSTSQTLLFHPAYSIQVGATLVLPGSERDTLFQVTEMRLDTLAWDGSRQIVSVAAARQIGVVDDGYLRIAPDLPEPHAKIRTYSANASNQLPSGFTRIGRVAGTAIPIGVSHDPAMRGHVAILGMTGMGKTTIVNRVCQALGPHLAVVALDVTGEYAARLGWPLFDPSDFNSPGCRVLEPSGELTTATGAFISDLLSRARTEYTAGQTQHRLVVFEEAHAMLPEQNISDWDQKKRVGETTRDIMQSRKYGLTYLFVSQRTAVISKSALSQCESYIVLRTLDDTSLTYLEAIAGPVVRSVVPSLGRYQALCFGPAFNSENPVVVDLDQPPPQPTTGPPPAQVSPPVEEPPF